MKMTFGKRSLETANSAFIMGIVNCTPDSFYSGSAGNYKESVNHALKLIDEGADVLDLGGESTRPGASYTSLEEELERVIPVLREIRKHSSIPVSIDTRKKAVMEAAFNEGADVLNDVSSLEDDEEMASFCGQKGLGVILMHKRGIPSNMQADGSYNDAFNEVSSYLSSRAEYAVRHGIKAENIIVDPGIGFGKDLKANTQLISRCGELCGGKYPVLMALSRKSCIGEMTGKTAEGRLSGTVAADLVAVLKGASMLRVHDVSDCRDSLMVLQYFIKDNLI